MKTADLVKIAEQLHATAFKVRAARRTARQQDRAWEAPAVGKLFPPPVRTAQARQRRHQIRDGLNDAVRDAVDVYTIAEQDRAAWSLDAWLARAQRYPRPGVEWSIDDDHRPPSEADFLTAADRAERAAREQDRAMQRELLERMARRDTLDEIRIMTPGEIVDRLARLDVSTERGAAELHLYQRGLRDTSREWSITDREQVQHALDEARGRVVLPPQFRAAQAAFAEMDFAKDALEANWESLRSGDDAPADLFERSKFIIEDSGKLRSLARSGERVGGTMTGTGPEDPARWESFRAAEADADAKSVDRIAREIVQATARAGLPESPPAAT